MSIAGGVAGKRKSKPLGMFWHNDAGSKNATAKYWEHFYQLQKKGSYPFAHYYCDKDNIVQVEDDNYGAWHCGSSENMTYLSLEVCQSIGADDQTFLANEEQAIKLTANLFKKYGIEPNAKTVRLHREVYKTACPHRSIALHGGTVESCKAYLINKIKEYMQDKEIKKIGEEIMQCLVSNNGAVTFYDFDKLIKFVFSSSNQLAEFKTIYRANHDGQNILHLNSTAKENHYATVEGLFKKFKEASNV